MPTYDYECDACGHTMELFQGINDPVKKKCPECKKNKLRRLLGGGAAVVFKGSGFYQTDYRSDGYKKAAKADKSDASGKSSGEKSSGDKSSGGSKTAAPSGEKSAGKSGGAGSSSGASGGKG